MPTLRLTMPLKERFQFLLVAVKAVFTGVALVPYKERPKREIKPQEREAIDEFFRSQEKSWTKLKESGLFDRD